MNTQGSRQPDSRAEHLDVRRFVEGLPVAAYMCDAQGLITCFNRRAAEAWGREPKLSDPADRYCGSFRMWSPEGSPILHEQCWMARCLREKRVFDGEEIVVERPDGRRLHVEVHATPFFDDQGALLGAVNIVLDITERKRAENALHEKHRSLATLAHELKAPLARAVELLRLKDLPDPELRDARDILERQVPRMSRLVDDLLDAKERTAFRPEGGGPLPAGAQMKPGLQNGPAL